MMNFTEAPGHEMGSSSMSNATSIVFVVDDDISVRESLDLLLRSAGWQPETFSCAQDFLGRARAPVPSCLVLDISMPGLNGLEVQKRVAAEHPHLPIIFITGHGDVPRTVQAMKAGAVEFLTKPFNNDVLLSAIRQSLERSRVALGQQAENQELRDRYSSLSPREREVMALVVGGPVEQAGGWGIGHQRDHG
jgi:FixJ family two-component response regulator